MRICAVLAVAACASACAAQTPIVTFRMRERHHDTTVGAPGDFGAATPTASDAGDAHDRTLWFVVDVMMTGAPASVRGLSAVEGSIEITSGSGIGSGVAGGAFKVTNRGFNASPSGGPAAFWFPDAPPGRPAAIGSNDRAFYQPFRLISNLGEAATGVVSPDGIRSMVDAASGPPIQELSQGELTRAAFGRNTWIPLYTFQYDVTDNSPRTLTFATNLNASAFSAWDLFFVPNAIETLETQASYSVEITDVPAPTAALAALIGTALAGARRRRRSR